MWNRKTTFKQSICFTKRLKINIFNEMERYTLYKIFIGILKTVTGVYQSFSYSRVVWVKDKKNACNLKSKICFLSFIKAIKANVLLADPS